MRKGVVSKDKILFERDYEKLFNACADEYDRLFVVCCGELGLRSSEVAALRKSWIDERRGRIKIAMHDEDWSAKTPASSRVIPAQRMSTRAWAVILEFFKSRERVSRSRITVWRRIHLLGKKCGLDVFPHSLRATTATRLANRIGSNPFALCTIMGWKNVSGADSYIRLATSSIERMLDESIGEDF